MRFFLIAAFFTYGFSLLTAQAHFKFSNNENEVMPVILDSNSGFGNMGRDDYSADIILRKNCINQLKANLYCDSQSSSIDKLKPAFSEIDELALTEYFREYTFRTTYSFSDYASNKKLSKKCHQFLTQSKLKIENPYYLTRIIDRSDDSIIKAIVLNELYGKNGVNNKEYIRRLKIKYPVIFPENDLYYTVANLLMDGIGDNIFKQSSVVTGNEFSITIDAIYAKLSTDIQFKKNTEAALKLLRDTYERDLVDSSNEICNMSLGEIYSKYPSNFNQALIDLPGLSRIKATNILCSKDFWYDPNTFDSDCDGINDKKDRAPLDPYFPTNKIHLKGRSATDPPFGSNYDYTIEKKFNTLFISTKLNFSFEENLSAKEISEVKVKFEKCIENLEKKLSGLYRSFLNPTFKKYNAYQNELPPKANFKINAQFNSSKNTKESDFSIHKCYFSTGKIKLKENPLFDDYIPKNTCLKDFTPEMNYALSDKKLNPLSNGYWSDQEDAANLTVNSDCDTLQHELIHRFGLPDEYSSDYYPFNKRGVTTSIMNHSSLKEATLLPRHVASIISPSQCDRSNGNHD